MILRDADLGGNILATCRKFNISAGTYYAMKKKYGDEYNEIKESDIAKATVDMFETSLIKSSEIRVSVEERTKNTMIRSLDIIDLKLENEKRRLEGDEDITEKLSMKDIVSFLNVVSQYIMKPQGGGDNSNRSLLEHHKHITQVLNQHNLIINEKSKKSDED
jgi:hypothetical protein